MSRLIGLGGKLRAGKDALAEYYAREHDFVVMGMSDALNEALLKLNPLIQIPVWTEVPRPQRSMVVQVFPEGELVRYQQLHDALGYVEAKRNPEVRRLLQVLGTEVGRDMIDQNVWVDMARRRIEGYWAEGKNVVITALRFPNELAMVRDMGGLSVWMERPDSLRLSEVLEFPGRVETPEKGSEGGSEAHSAILSHASENSVGPDDFDAVLYNTGTLQDLYNYGDVVLNNYDTAPRGAFTG